MNLIDNSRNLKDEKISTSQNIPNPNKKQLDFINVGHKEGIYSF